MKNDLSEAVEKSVNPEDINIARKRENISNWENNIQRIQDLTVLQKYQSSNYKTLYLRFLLTKNSKLYSKFS